MDYSAQYQYQQPAVSQSTDPSQIQAYAYDQYQQGVSQSADPSQFQQAYDQSTTQDPYYPSYQYNQDYNQQQYQYSYYPQKDYYSNAAYQQQQPEPESEPTSIHPPGVPIPPPSSSDPYASTQQEQPQPQYSYYPQQQPQGINYGEVATVSMPIVSHTPANVQSPYRGRGKRGGRSYRGGAHAHLGGGQLQPSYDQPNSFQGASLIQGGPSQVKPSSSASGNSGSVQPPPRMAVCELCRVECNTPEVLEQHKNGKKHKKNLKANEELKKLNKSMDGGQGHQTANFDFKPNVYYRPEVGGAGQLPQGHLPFEVVTGNRQSQPQENFPSHAVLEDGSITGKQKVEEAAPVEELARDLGMHRVQGQGRGLKRMLRGGRGGKLMKLHNGSRKPAVPPKPKKMVPLICELCNVTCESVVVFQSHLAGKKHLSNVKDFQGQQAMVGQAALQALYPALQALYPALQALCQPNTGASTSMAPQGHQPNLHEILGMLTQQALSAIPQDQVLGIGIAANSALPPSSDLEAQDHQGSILQGSVSEKTRENAATVDGRNCDLSVLQNTGSKPEENTDIKHENVNLQFETKVMSVEEPLRNAVSETVPSTPGAVVASVSVSNSEVAPSDCAAHSCVDVKLVDQSH
ncbi:PREDICTED: uncharacterized protein LOC109214868 isoform X1 [Nicotiana attenuata]|uniref:U1-type domain-containing protein n=1 Tax=Nicotiana attenuata TaxID=49451 RepID=A0A1J6KYT7_NICAT|nr:PREDICTED: uncharacterized protein LOC109214868 isoform X1 [Nicotiana attenuata]OIT26783.1 hypothetical protein A4A49_31739 [Nicotiana attenuata]